MAQRDPAQELKALEGQLPPFDVDVEGIVLGELLVNAAPAYDRIVGILDDRMFWSDANRTIFQIIAELQNSSQLVDAATVASRAKEKKLLDRVGGTPYITQLATSQPAPGPYLEQHARKIRDLWRRRRVIALARETVVEGYGDVGNPQEWMEEKELAFSELTHSAEERQVQPIGKFAADHLNKVWEARREGRSLSGIPTGFVKLDSIISGLHAGDLYLIAARPGIGKTSFLTSLLMNVSTPAEPEEFSDMFDNEGLGNDEKIASLMFSLEQPAEQLSMRVLCSTTGASFDRLRSNHFHNEDYDKLIKGCQQLITVPFYVDDQPAITLVELKAKAKKLQRQIENGTASVEADKLGVIGVDYAQLMQGEKAIRATGNREREVSSISQGLKNIAKELGVPVIALAQLNRGVEKREDKHPTLSDLRESGALEQDADTIIFLYREAYYDKKSKDPSCDVDVAKQRNGPTQMMKVIFEPESMSFRNMTDEEAAKFGETNDEENPDGHY